MKLTQSEITRFWSKVAKSVTGCWEWTGSKSVRGGYGELNIRGRAVKAHRIAYFLSNPGADTSLFVCHTCDNPPCVNPHHLFLGTNLDNIKDMVRKNRNYSAFRVNPPFGESNVTSVLTTEQVLLMREIRERQGLSYRAISEMFGVGRTTAYYAIRLGWRHLPRERAEQ